MEKQFAYQFPTAAKASKFLAELKSGYIGFCKVKRFNSDLEILVTYTYNSIKSFDDNAQKLDDLAEQLEGQEISSY